MIPRRRCVARLCINKDLSTGTLTTSQPTSLAGFTTSFKTPPSVYTDPAMATTKESSSGSALFERVQLFLPSVVVPAKAKTNFGDIVLKKSLGVLDMESRLGNFEGRLEKLVISTVFKAIKDHTLDLDAYKYYEDKHGKLKTTGSAAAQATANEKKKKLDFYWRELHLCLLFCFFNVADPGLRRHGESFLIGAYQSPSAGEAIPDSEAARKLAPVLWQRFKTQLLAEAKANRTHHSAMPLLEFVLGTVDRRAWQRTNPGCSTAAYLRDGLQRGFDTLAQLGVTFSDEAKAALAWEALRGAEREALEGQTGDLPAEGKVAQDAVVSKAIKDSFILLRQSFEGQGGDSFDVRREQLLFQQRLGVLREASPGLFVGFAGPASNPSKPSTSQAKPRGYSQPQRDGYAQQPTSRSVSISGPRPCQRCNKPGHRAYDQLTLADRRNATLDMDRQQFLSGPTACNVIQTLRSSIDPRASVPSPCKSAQDVVASAGAMKPTWWRRVPASLRAD